MSRINSLMQNSATGGLRQSERGDGRVLHQAVKRALRVLLCLGLLALILFFVPPFPEDYGDLERDTSLALLDRSGRTLRSQLSARGGLDSWVELEQIPKLLQQAILSAEDRRFYYHPGVDPMAMIRAARDNLQAGRVVSGASTITQQTLRTLRPAERSWKEKLKEAYWALRFECRFSKREILEAYLNRASFGPSVHGVREASRYYFGKNLKSLTPAEIAVLAVVLRSPSSLNPFAADEDELRRWTTPVLETLKNAGALSPESFELALNQKLETSSQGPSFRAPHFCDLVLSRTAQGYGRVSTTLDLELQIQVEAMVENHMALLASHKVDNAAVVVCEIESGEVLALVGSADYGQRRFGQHNAATALRQPGSTLKPFTYALFLQDVGHAGAILADLNLYSDSNNESYIPQNYDRRFHGPVTLRTALACSYNVPAVRALERVGAERLLPALRRLGFEDLEETPEHYGLGLTLGAGSASLVQLVQAYRVLARGGKPGGLTFLKDAPSEDSGEQIFDSRVCYILEDVLSDPLARIPAFGASNCLEFPFPVAAKTGTSKGYRDNWVLGYTSEHVVGVWVGNSDGSPMRGVSGITGAGPLFRDIVLSLEKGSRFAEPSGLERRTLCLWSGEQATENCETTSSEPVLKEISIPPCRVCQRDERGRRRLNFPSIFEEWAQSRELISEDSLPGNTSELFRFTFPLDGDVFTLDPDLRPDYQKLRIRTAGAVKPLRWYVDGKLLEGEINSSLSWSLRPGNHSFKAVDSRGSEARLSCRVSGEAKSN